MEESISEIIDSVINTVDIEMSTKTPTDEDELLMMAATTAATDETVFTTVESQYQLEPQSDQIAPFMVPPTSPQSILMNHDHHESVSTYPTGVLEPGAQLPQNGDLPNQV